MHRSERHLRLVTETIAAVNSTLDLDELFELVARKVADALEADASFVYLYDDTVDQLVLRASIGSYVEESANVPRLRSGEGITGAAVAAREPIMIARAAHTDPRFKQFPSLHEEQFESILAVPIVAKEILEGALNVRTLEPREFDSGEIDLLMAIAAQVAQAIENAKLYNQARRRVAELEALARISEAVSESLYIEECLEEIVSTTIDAVGATGVAVVLPDGTVAWPKGTSGTHAVRVPLRWNGRQIGELVCDRDAPFTSEDRTLLTSLAHQAAVALVHGRTAMRGVLAQEIHHRVKNNLQTVASMLRLQARSKDVDPRQALEDSVNRILAIAAVHEVLTEQQEDDVELSELLERLRAMIIQGLGAGKSVEANVARVSLEGARSTPLALVFSELLQNALEHGGEHVTVELRSAEGVLNLVVSDDGEGIGTAKRGTGLSIVEALVENELQGELVLEDMPGLRATARFPL
ncbi:MAG: sensor histidine kinase [Gaiellaceae bacterium]